MKTLELESASPERTQEFAARLAKALKPLDLLCLSGGLGAGKTTFVQGLARGLGCRARVTSPSFGLAREYRSRSRRLTLYHLDLYRLAGAELGNVGLEEYLCDPAGACAIEWPEAAAGLLPADRLELKFSHAPGGRRLQARAEGARARELLAVLAPPSRS